MLKALEHRFNSHILSERPGCLLNRKSKVATFALISLFLMLLDLQMSSACTCLSMRSSVLGPDSSMLAGVLSMLACLAAS